MSGRPRNTPDSVWKKISQAGEDECWPWQGHIGDHGYGRITIDYVDHLAHRVVFTLVKGDPGSLWVLHTCDNPPCCNPAHLYAGTPEENSQDRDSRGRSNSPRGERHGHAKLSDRDVLAIRRRVRAGEKQKDIAADMSVSRATISRIINYKRRAA